MASPTGQAGTARFPKVLQVPVTAEVDERIRADATTHRLSIAEVARTYIDAGIDAADELVSTP